MFLQTILYNSYMEFYAYSGLFNGIIAMSLGALVISYGWRDKINKVYFLLAASTALWGFGYWLWLNSTSIDSALFWIRIASIGSLFIPISYFHWVSLVLGIAHDKKKIIRASYLISIIFLLFSFSDFFISGVQQKLFFDFWPNPGILYSLYLAFIYFGLFSYAIYLLFKKYKLSANHKKSKILYIILGSIAGFGGGATNFFLWYDIAIPPYGNFLVALYPIILAYATLKYELFNAKLIATELLVFIIWIAIFAEVLLADSFKEKILESGLLIFVIIFGVLIIRSVLNEVRQKEELAKLSSKLQKANEHLKELDKLKSDFVSIASHQLRSPLTVIKGYSSMMLEGSMGGLSEKAKHAVDRMYKSSERLINFVNELLDVSRIERGKMQYNFERADICEVVESVVDEFQQIVRTKNGLKLEFIKPDRPIPDLSLDKIKIRQVIVNLIDNAIKYTPRGKIEVSILKQQKSVEVRVLDTGIGMERGDINKLFDQFVRGDGVVKISGTGSGLGLYVAREMARGHKGDVTVISSGKGEGSTFILSLPIDNK